jgi:tetratricopeptide (TPR) repeat protein
MKCVISAIVFLFVGQITFFAQGTYPLTEEISVYFRQNSIYDRLDQALARINRESVEYNKTGYASYERRDWDKALEYFYKALKLDDNNPFAHYNTACTLALKFGARASKDILAQIVAHLEKSSRIDISFCIQLFIDPDLDSVRRTGYEAEKFYLADITPALYKNYWKNGSITLREVFDSKTGEWGFPKEGEAPPEYVPKASPYPPTGFYCYIGDTRIEYCPKNDNPRLRFHTDYTAFIVDPRE